MRLIISPSVTLKTRTEVVGKADFQGFQTWDSGIQAAITSVGSHHRTCQCGPLKDRKDFAVGKLVVVKRKV